MYMKDGKKFKFILATIIVSIFPYFLNLIGIDFSSHSTTLISKNTLVSTISSDEQFYALSGAMHHALLEWTAVTLAVIAGFSSFIHYYRYRDISVPIIGLAILCAGFTDAFHTLAATRIISANVPNSDFIPFTWAFSRIFNVCIMIIGILLSLSLSKNVSSTYSKLAQRFSVQGNNKNHQDKILLLISFIFISLAITAVMTAATSSSLPQTTFANALITRPYDVIPLALFVFSGALIWHWYKLSSNLLKFALLMSLIPEIATQFHMSFGSSALFDNHFNIAHFLKIFAYSILTSGLLASLFDKKHLDNRLQIDLAQAKNAHTKYPQEQLYNQDNLLKTEHLSKKNNLLTLGTVKYPQSIIFSTFSFILVLLVTFMVSSIYSTDNEKLAKQQKMAELAIQGDFIEPLLKSIYQESRKDLVFLSKTPEIQGIIDSLRENKPLDYQLWQQRLSAIFTSILQKNRHYLQIRYVDSFKQKEIVKNYKSGQQIVAGNKEQLEVLSKRLLSKDSMKQQGQVSFFNDLMIQDLNYADDKKTEKTVVQQGFLNVVLPIFSRKNNELFGVLHLKINFTDYLQQLNLAQLSDKQIYLASTSGLIIYKAGPEKINLQNKQTEEKLQQLFPYLGQAIANNTKEFQLTENAIDTIKKNTTTAIPLSSANKLQHTDSQGHYRTIFLQQSDVNNIIRLFIKMDEQAILSQISTFKTRGLLIGIGLAVIALALALLLSRRLSQSLILITQELKRFSETGEMKNLPINANDESGLLARSFHNFLLLKAKQDQALILQKFALDEHAIVSITDIKGSIKYSNEKFTEISGYSKQELLGENHRILNSANHSKQFFKQLYHTISNGRTWQGEICNRAKGGHLYWVNTTIVPSLNANGKPESYISIRTDITSDKLNSQKLFKAKDNLSKQVSKLEQANAELDQFAYVASHDLKSPLNGISQLVSWLEEDCYEILPEDSKEHLELLKSRSKRMIALLNDLLEYSRAGRKDYLAEKINLAQLTDDIFDLQGNREGFTCNAENIEIIVPKVPFQLVIRNLISNAIKHHDKATGHITISLTTSAEYYLIRIQDDGPGIPTSLHDKAIEMFQTLQSRDTTEGSGMGLALVKKTVAYHGGTLAIDSNDTRGTGIMITWPISVEVVLENSESLTLDTELT